MKRVLLTALAGLAAAGVWAAGSAASGGGSAEPAPAPGAVSVSAREFALTLSRPGVRAGRVRLQLINRGEDDHDLWIGRVRGTRSWSYPVTGPGEASTRTLGLRPGRYRMICTLEGHEALGMRARLRVRRQGPRAPGSGAQDAPLGDAGDPAARSRLG